MQSHSAAAMVTMVMSPKPESPKKKPPSISLMILNIFTDC
jgi:hypothetical protein